MAKSRHGREKSTDQLSNAANAGREQDDERRPSTRVLDAINELASLRDAFQAYEAVEKLVGVVVLSDSQDIHATRDELSALLRVVNGELTRRIDTVEQGLEAILEALDG
jgi:hypothetical protein